MKEFVKEHPFLTFFLAGAAINGVVEIVRILKRPRNAWPEPPRFEGIPGLISIQRGCDCEPHTMFATGANAPSGTCPPGLYYDPATQSCVPFPMMPPFGG